MGRKRTDLYVPKSGDRFRKCTLRRTAARHLEIRTRENLIVSRKPALMRGFVLRVETYTGAKFLMLMARTVFKREMLSYRAAEINLPKPVLEYKAGRNPDKIEILCRAWIVTAAHASASVKLHSDWRVGFSSLNHAQAERDALEFHYAKFLLTRKD